MILYFVCVRVYYVCVCVCVCVKLKFACLGSLALIGPSLCLIAAASLAVLVVAGVLKLRSIDFVIVWSTAKLSREYFSNLTLLLCTV